MKSINKLFIAVFSLVTLAASCKKDFLDRPPQSQIASTNFYKTTAELRLATASLYGGSIWFDWQYFPILGIGDVLSGNILQPYNANLVQLTTFSITGGNEYVATSWRGMYKIVAHANTNIKAINENASDTIPRKDVNAALGELRFMRATAYFQLAQMFGAVPIIEDNTKLIDSSLLRRNKIEDVYRFIVEDLTYASQVLPVTDVAGRVTKWSAMGMLSKVYLTRAGLNQNMTRNQAYLDSAKTYAGAVCNNSGLTLLPNYYNLFRSQFNDNVESLFALQWTVGVGYGNSNGIQTQFAPSGDIVSGGGYGGAIGPTYDLYRLYSNRDTVRRKATFMLMGDYYPELNAAGGGYRVTNNANIKKHIIGTASDNNAPTMGSFESNQHNALLRLADVYLIYAEAIKGNSTTTSDPQALLYFNKVRIRAGVDSVTSINDSTLMSERRIELAFEGQYWFDLVRLSYYNPQKAISMLNSQQRVQFVYNATTRIATPNVQNITITPATSGTFTLPLPTNEITADPRLLDPPVAYY